MFVYNPHSKNKRRYWDDYKIEDSERPEVKRCINFNAKRCRTRDPVSGVEIQLLFITDYKYICQNCKDQENIDKWFKNLQATEIPTTLPQFRKLKGRLRYDINDNMPPIDDPCWQFYSIIEEYL